ncbi:MAG: membrane or secreted protein [Bacteroidota bacterium]
MRKFTFLLSLLFIMSSAGLAQMMQNLQGAFTSHENGDEHAIILQDNYFMHTVYNVAGKLFKYSEGGSFKLAGDSLIQLVEFSTKSPQMVGERRAYKLEANLQEITLSGSNTGKQKWTKADNGNSPLAGNWRITGRKEGDSIRQMQRGARKTLKLLSGTRFQWAAINPQTKEFFGTGGGTYTFENGKYTETIQFFSRDSTRVGAVLSFDGAVKDGQWHHSGKSSTGNPIYEIWSREK